MTRRPPAKVSIRRTPPPARADAPGEALRIVRDDVMLAVGREYQKLGRPVTRADFGEAYETVMETLFASAAGGDDG